MGPEQYVGRGVLHEGRDRFIDTFLGGLRDGLSKWDIKVGLEYRSAQDS